MGLSGREVLKALPRTDCGECGEINCFAFSFNVVAGKKDISECPFASEQLKKRWAESLNQSQRTK